MLGVHVAAGLGDAGVLVSGWPDDLGGVSSGVPGGLSRGWRSVTAGLPDVGSCGIRGAGAGVRGRAKEGSERGYRFEQQRVDAGLLVGGVTGAELGDRAAVLGLGGELAYPGGDGGGHAGHRAAWRGVVSPG